MGMPNPVFRSKAFQRPIEQAKDVQHANYQHAQGQPQRPDGAAGQSTAGYQSGGADTISPDQLAHMYQPPSASAADTGRMTYSSVINRTRLVFLMIIAVEVF